MRIKEPHGLIQGCLTTKASLQVNPTSPLQASPYSARLGSKVGHSRTIVLCGSHFQEVRSFLSLLMEAIEPPMMIQESNPAIQCQKRCLNKCNKVRGKLSSIHAG